MIQLNDDCILHVGKKYNGYQLRNVPAGYLLYIYKHFVLPEHLKKYISEREKVLKEKAKATIKTIRR